MFVCNSLCLRLTLPLKKKKKNESVEALRRWFMAEALQPPGAASMPAFAYDSVDRCAI
jgi:hypothetical protein